MKFSIAATALAGSALVGVTSAALDPIVVKGTKFFNKETGEQFFLKGVAYQTDPGNANNTGLEPTTYKDPLADEEACKRDIPKLKELQTNVIRVYAIDPEEDHEGCMKLLDDAGIYVVSDLSEPQTSINRDSPAWDDTLYARYTAVIDEMAQYTNTLGFFAGNEVSNVVNNTNASAFVKAAVRDSKAYIKEQKLRAIPVGYATNDDAEIRLNLAHYFNCGTEEESVDFWGYNIYSWCGKSSFTESGYDTRTEEFENYSKPVFLAEYGCNKVRPREFTDVKALYGPDMTDVWSGGIVYMYHEEKNEYGLVKVDGDKIKELDDFTYLKNQIKKVDPKGTTLDKYTPKNTKLETCPATGKDWQASANLPPTPNQDTCDCMVKSLECVPSGTPSAKEATELFDYICGDGGADCTGIAVDGEKGEYGAYSMCSTQEKLSYVMNQIYIKNNKASTACDFEGMGKKQTPKDSDSTCDALIKNAEDGATATSSTGSASGAESSDEPSSDDADSAAAMPSMGSPALAVVALIGAALVMV